MHTNHVDFKPIYIEIYRKSSMPSYFRVFWKEASHSCYFRLKGNIVRKTSNFENSNQQERKLTRLVFLFGYFIQSILNKIEMPQTHLPNLWLLLVLNWARYARCKSSMNTYQLNECKVWISPNTVWIFARLMIALQRLRNKTYIRRKSIRNYIFTALS